ncbi:LytR/AlgR family response regulator transcription factor [Maribellus maritimus]|uniref:LytR/AlgR family response regulator transcription factor n=1 Tax=Maribellus maritimus TaxID=2870838 RepID=UPI001EEAB394|nr:LytTR family DNA-binding domain-containing protein [Maribellus maritimus]MCG6189024.1 LytTR family DNA-binding domain-containing protein [Maribellus maritimus]
MENEIKILIVEDEPLAAAQLAALIASLKPGAKILEVCDTVKSAINWISKNDEPDLAFFDIQLGDGLSFEIFEQVDLNCPVIFVTAYDQYAIQAFKVNSVDYILKPIEKKELENALQKYERIAPSKPPNLSPGIIEEIVSSFSRRKFKERFLAKVGSHLRIIEIYDVLYFYSYQKGTYVKLADGKDYLLDYSLEMIEEMVNPSAFFRINRKYLISLQSIQDVIAYSNSRLKLKVQNPAEDDFLVAREKVKTFKKWIEGDS